MAGPGDSAPAVPGGDGARPAPGAGREQVIIALKAAFVQGRLTKDEFELRVGQALAIYAELDALTADIPAVPAAAAAAARAEEARQAANKKMIQQGTAGVAGLVFLLDAVLVMPRYPVPGLIAGVLLTLFISVLVAGFLTLLSWALDRRAGTQSAPGSPPGAGGDDPRQRGAADQRGWFPEIGQDPPHTAEAASRGPRRPTRFQARPAALTS